MSCSNITFDRIPINPSIHDSHWSASPVHTVNAHHGLLTTERSSWPACHILHRISNAYRSAINHLVEFFRQAAWLPLAKELQDCYKGPVYTVNLPSGRITGTDYDIQDMWDCSLHQICTRKSSISCITEIRISSVEKNPQLFLP
jgi:hypothetical protein